MFWPEFETNLENEFIRLLLSCCFHVATLKKCLKKSEATNDDKKCKMRLKFPFPVLKMPQNFSASLHLRRRWRKQNKIILEWKMYVNSHWIARGNED